MKPAKRIDGISNRLITIAIDAETPLEVELVDLVEQALEVACGLLYLNRQARRILDGKDLTEDA